MREKVKRKKECVRVRKNVSENEKEGEPIIRERQREKR
jgi:hypothetical protein